MKSVLRETIAYFSDEIGLESHVPTYSDGLENAGGRYDILKSSQSTPPSAAC
jgi:hypothetical protein